MKSENTVFLISKSTNAAEIVQSKILLMRNIDDFVHVDYKNCFEEISKAHPCAIFFDVRDHEEEFYEFIKKIKQTPSLSTASVILLFNTVNEEVLCNAFEAGISDFLTLNSFDSEFTVRVLWAIQKKEHAQDFQNKKNILAQLNILDKKTDIYTKNYTYTILKEQSKKKSGTLAVIAPDVNTRSKLSPQLLASIVRKNVRITDTLGFSGDFKLYAWFSHANPQTVVDILEKIKKQLPPQCTISAGIAQSTSFDIAEENANKALSDALLAENSSVVYKETKKEEVQGEVVSYKNYKMFKQNFLKKFENIVSPIFYQTQKIIEEKLFETSVKQEINENESIFLLKHDDCESVFKITYPAYTKINIDLIHKTPSGVFENRVRFEIEELDPDRISALLDDFIKEFQKFI